MADPEPVPITRTREFWTLVGYAAVFGSVMGLVAYVFLAIVEWATDVLWTDTDSYGWFAGEPWWILLMGGVGLTIGIIRRVLRVQPVIPGLFDEIDERRVEPATVPRRVLVGFVSLIGGASVGPEAPLASIGGGLATWVSERRQEPESVAETNTLVAMAGAFGGLFSAPMISALLVVEAATPEGGRRRYAVTAIPVLIAAVAGFAVYFALAQTTFVDVYQVPPYSVDLWDFVVAIPLGVLGALLAGLLGFTMATVRKGAMRFRSRPVVLATLGGLALGVIAFALPLTRFAGAAELTTLLDHAPELGAALVIVLILAKILAVA
ncbi:MAG: chloride channel protein, partial [Actinobacteria bacterium]|nr:chloride channel protein [Actinomycetota bacterium]